MIWYCGDAQLIFCYKQWIGGVNSLLIFLVYLFFLASLTKDICSELFNLFGGKIIQVLRL